MSISPCQTLLTLGTCECDGFLREQFNHTVCLDSLVFAHCDPLDCENIHFPTLIAAEVFEQAHHGLIENYKAQFIYSPKYTYTDHEYYTEDDNSTYKPRLFHDVLQKARSIALSSHSHDGDNEVICDISRRLQCLYPSYNMYLQYTNESSIIQENYNINDINIDIFQHTYNLHVSPTISAYFAVERSLLYIYALFSMAKTYENGQKITFDQLTQQIQNCFPSPDSLSAEMINILTKFRLDPHHSALQSWDKLILSCIHSTEPQRSQLHQIFNTAVCSTFIAIRIAFMEYSTTDYALEKMIVSETKTDVSQSNCLLTPSNLSQLYTQPNYILAMLSSTTSFHSYITIPHDSTLYARIQNYLKYPRTSWESHVHTHNQLKKEFESYTRLINDRYTKRLELLCRDDPRRYSPYKCVNIKKLSQTLLKQRLLANHNTCVVCLIDFEAGEVVVTPYCGTAHSQCFTCFSACIERDRSCPICRQDYFRTFLLNMIISMNNENPRKQ